MNLIPENFHFSFIKYSKYAFCISALLIFLGIITYFIVGLKFSIDFNGGTTINVSISDEQFDLTNLREHLKKNIDEGIIIVETGRSNQKNNISLTMPFIEDENIVNNSLKSIYKDNFSINQIESIGPKIGDELSTNARNAFLAALLLIGLYITIRFDSFYALGSLVALLHDIAITLSILILFQYEISISIIAALLTIIGYSLNDTIVIYDRIRENIKLNPESNKKEIAEKSLNITLNRTVITSLTTLLVVAILFILGGNVLKPFSLTLIIGIITGTYSSLFVATPIMLALEKKYKLDDLEET